MAGFSPKAWAKRLASAGLNVLPARAGEKAPSISWLEYQHRRLTAEEIDRLFQDVGVQNFWVACGQVSGGLVVPDADSLATITLWDALFAETMAAAFTIRTAKGAHFYLHSGSVVRPWSWHGEVKGFGSIKFDVRGDGSGVVGPRSVHESGIIYLRDPERAGRLDSWDQVELPDDLRSEDAWLARLKREGLIVEGTEEATGEDERSGSSTLAFLLAHPPAGEGEGRNVWLSRVAGHYAKAQPFRDSYMATVMMANSSLSEPLSMAEARKTAASIWKAEQAGKSADVDDEGRDLECDMIQNRVMSWFWEKSSSEWVAYPWSNFRPVVRTLFTSAESSGDDVFDLEVVLTDGSVRRLKLRGSDCGNSRALNGKLASVGATIDQQVGDKGRPESRFLRLLHRIAERRLEAVSRLGWDDDEKGVVVFEGTITMEGLREPKRKAPRPGLERLAGYRYGFRPEDETREALREVLTFQSEKVAGVFGAWWAATMLAPQVLRKIGHFPFMALEAPSESGKTQGFFKLLTRMAGGLGGGVQTTAALRDSLSATSFGIVWADDMQRPGDIFELIRGGGGAFTKKGVDLADNVRIEVLAPLMLSGESLGLQEKAMRDRSIRLSVGSPVERMSLKEGRSEAKQWEDVVAFMDQYPELWEFAGTLVMLSLRERGLVDSLLSFRLGSGRVADSVAVLRMGARLLSSLAEDDRWQAVVDEWIENEMDREDGNLLTTKILPDLLVDSGGGVATSSQHGPPLFIDQDGVMWISLSKVSARWLSAPGQRGDVRAKAMGSPESLKDQIRQVTGSDVRPTRFSTLPSRMKHQVDQLVSYWPIPATEASGIQRRAGIGVRRASGATGNE